MPTLFTLFLTAFSWFVLGIWYTVGYCPCTDWHWQVRRRLGYHDMPASYIKLLIDSLTGLDIDPAWADGLTVTCFLLACAASLLCKSQRQKKGSWQSSITPTSSTSAWKRRIKLVHCKHRKLKTL